MLRQSTRMRAGLLLAGVTGAGGPWTPPAGAQDGLADLAADPYVPAVDYDAWAEPLDPFDDEIYQAGPLTVCFDAARPPSAAFITRMHEVLAAHGRLAIEPRPLEGGGGPGIELYQLGSRWSGAQGSPRALTWSFAPDGLNIPNGIGEPAAPNELFARLDALFVAQGGRATWILRFEQSFARWSEISGLTYTRVTFGGNDWDDGAAWGTAGAEGLRGDVRISMKPIDGGSNTLAYNSFPSNGDMVMDRAELWSSATSQNRLLRNVIMHEHGHGLGFFHVCSSDSNFLMEPFLNTTFDGPRYDDLRAVHRHYGDVREADNSSATATDLGLLPIGVTDGVCDLPEPLTGTNTAAMSSCSIDANNEQDYFRFTVGQDSDVSVTLSPTGGIYDDNPQDPFSDDCLTGNNTDAGAIADLEVQLIAADGVTVLATADAAAAGDAEVLAAVAVPAGEVFLRVYEGNSPGQSQTYRLAIVVEAGGSVEPCPGDVDGDEDVDLDDLLVLLGNFGMVVAPGTSGDFDSDGDVDLDDLLVVLGVFGTSCG